MTNLRKVLFTGLAAALVLLAACSGPKPSGFTLQLSNESLTLAPGGTASVTVTAQPKAGFKEEVSLTLENAPAGVTGTFSENPTASSSVLELSAASSVAAGSYALEVQANASSGSKASASLSVTVSVSEETPLPDFRVNEDLKPDPDALVDIDGKTLRPLGAISDGEGIEASFVLGELLVSTADKAALDALLTRWNGKIFDEIVFSGTDLPNLYVVQLDPTGVDLADLEKNLRSLGGVGEGEVQFSSASGLNLLAVAAEEMAEHGLVTSLNWVPEREGIEDGSSSEAGSGAPGYTPDAFQWPYMNSGSAQDIGVDLAWQTLNALGRFEARSKVKLMVIDGGFIDLGDYPAGAGLEGVNWRTPNGASCSGGSACPWHGTMVAHTALGQLDNGIGVAGPAGPVADLAALQFGGGFDFRAMARMLGLALIAPLLDAPDIINISAGVEIPPVLNVGVNRLLDPIFDRIHDRGTLIVTSAGNDGKDVDQKMRVFTRFERSTIIPCETSSVICVGGMDWDSTDKAGGSNYGSDAEADSVDIYGPYIVWVPQITADGTFTGTIEKMNGTSFSSPFVAGVAALIKAARPGFGAPEIASCLLRSAHDDVRVHPNGGNQRRVDAFASVTCALSRDTFPLVAILEPEEAITAVGRTTLTFKAFGVDRTGEELPISWESSLDGSLGTYSPGSPLRWDSLSVGTHTLTARVRDTAGTTREDSITVTITNNAPTVTIIAPSEGSRFGTNQSITLSGISEDIDTGPLVGLEDSRVGWSIAGVSFSAAGHTASIPAGLLAPGSYSVTFTGNDGEASASDSVDIEVTACTANCPTASIVRPARNAVIDANTYDAKTNSYYVTVTFEGVASDLEDGTLGGKKMYWTSVSDTGARSGLCTPLTYERVDIGCDTFSTKLYGSGGSGTTYSITLEVGDSDGNTASDTITIIVRNPGPI